ncbi:MAG: hypothetical protein PHS93_08215 [Candidatus Omnitrophica bacterium]|nr:hypothetical protein [Candidatus Omnitrophota bacterium]
MKYDKKIIFYISEEDHYNFKKASIANKKSMSDVMRELITKYNNDNNEDYLRYVKSVQEEEEKKKKEESEEEENNYDDDDTSESNPEDF